MSALPHIDPKAENVLAKAVLNASKQLGLNQSELGSVLGIHRTAVSRLKSNLVLNPKSKEGELALLLIRLARSLFALTGGDQVWIRHFMRTPNRLTAGIPAEQIATIQGLMTVTRIVDGLRGKI
ncbi:hypothetical protein ADIMK_3064 [Marinobacterium lacunae]|uniref:Uncharacterized protein n=1 Tax=Marinobacterium lacunae TaxID=1232683 RepID=A0A081FVN7_9GAMM|nr:MbcA/ParS/Xre antitoxin family protein [Marinobacterium lacunae]KEA62592.1 hypothetical protein ADIMK_3064 [Marinobacterium lacunae]MBR9882901.1 DUF2384 domain-containing protein [Oceanospirillales bacterium]